MAGEGGTVDVLDADCAEAACGDLTVPAALAAVALRHADVTAVHTPEGTLTYRELLGRAAAVTSWIADATTGQAPVALLAAPGTSSIAAAVGVLGSRHPLVVLDIKLPPARWQHILDACGAELCLVEPTFLGEAAVLSGPRRVALDEVVPAGPAADLAAGLAAEPVAEPVGDAIAPDDVATIVFTSGSSGTPKGVVHSHGHLVREAALYAEATSAGPGDRLALLVPTAFAMGETTLMAGLLSGAGVSAWDPRERGLRGLAAWLSAERVGRAVMTPSLLRALADSGPARGSLGVLDVVLLSGETVTRHDVDLARQLMPTVTVVSVFGSSETGAVATFRMAAGEAVPADPLPLGTVVAGKSARILPEGLGDPVSDDPPADEPCADQTRSDQTRSDQTRSDQPGALQVAGRWLASGYLTSGDLAPLVPTPFAQSEDGGRTVLMGDVARADEHGLLHLVGRRDDVVKIRGYLVHPAEVEAVLRRTDGVADAVVTGTSAGVARLVAYVVPTVGGRTPAPAQLRRALRQDLPDWMVPSDLVMLDALPRTERGKVDRQALPRPQRPPLREPVTSWEHRIAGLWRQVLGRDDVGCDDVFTDLGGDSLTLEEFASRLQELHGVHLTSSHVAEAPTVSALARLVGDLESRRGSARRHGSVVTLRATGTQAPLFCFTGAGSSGQAFLPLARSLGDDWPVHALQPHGLEEFNLPDVSVAHAARRHLRVLRRLQPQGPFLLAGHSMGGVIALEAAHLLVEAGEEVEAVVLIDPALPGAMFRRVIDRSADGVPEPDHAATSVLPDFPRLTRGQRVSKSVRWGLAYGRDVFRPSARRADLFFHLGDVTTSPHRPRPWTGRAVLYVTEGYPGGAAAWDEVLLGPLHVDKLGGDHVSVLRAPHVDTVAADIIRTRAQARATAGAARGGTDRH